MTAIGQGYHAILSTNERGRVERRRAGTRKQAFAAADCRSSRWNCDKSQLICSDRVHVPRT
jgi:hypothetical protein